MRSKLREFFKPILYRMLGRRRYLHAQVYGKVKDIKNRRREEEEMQLLPVFVKPGDTVVDVGANYGYYTHRLSEIVGPSGRVIGFEPIPFTYEVNQRVLKHFGIENADVHQLGVGDENKKTKFTVPVAGFGGISGGLAHLSGRENDEDGKEKYYNFERNEEVDAEIVRLDDFLDSKIDALSFVKIDVEGGEYFAIDGMKSTISKYRPVMIVEIQPYFFQGYGISEPQLKELIQELGYKSFLFDDKEGILNLFEGDYLDRNYVLIPDEKVSDYDLIRKG